MKWKKLECGLRWKGLRMTNEEAKIHLMCLYVRNLDTASKEEQEALNMAILSLSAWDSISDIIKTYLDIEDFFRNNIKGKVR